MIKWCMPAIEDPEVRDFTQHQMYTDVELHLESEYSSILNPVPCSS